MRPWVLVLAALACASCEGSDGPATNSLTTAPSVPAVVTQVAPGSLRLATNGAVACGLGSAFIVGFDAVLVPVRTVTLDRVMVHLLDGTNLGGSTAGGSPFMFSNADLSRQFGSTVVVGTRTFPFEAPFGCVTFQPRSMAADFVFIDDFGIERVATITAPFP